MSKRVGALSKKKFRSTQHSSKLKVAFLFVRNQNSEQRKKFNFFINKKHGGRNFTYFRLSLLRPVRFPVVLEASVEAA